MLRLRRRDCQDLPPQLRFFEPARNRTLQNPRPALPQPPPGNDEHAALSRVPRGNDKRKERFVRLGLGHPMQIEPRLYPVQTALQPFSIGAVDPGKPGQWRQLRWDGSTLLETRNGLGSLWRAHLMNGIRDVAAQRPRVTNGLLPQSMALPRAC